MMLEPFTLEEAIYLALEGTYLIRRGQSIGERTVKNWPVHDEWLEECLWFERWVDTHRLK
jgi:hypothetical protein